MYHRFSTELRHGAVHHRHQGCAPSRQYTKPYQTATQGPDLTASPLRTRASREISPSSESAPVNLHLVLHTPNDRTLPRSEVACWHRYLPQLPVHPLSHMPKRSQTSRISSSWPSRTTRVHRL